MSLNLAVVARDMRALWTRDRDLLLRIAPPFLFLPLYAVLLLLPPLPELPLTSGMGPAESEAAIATWTMGMQSWLARFGIVYFGAYLAGLYGALAIVAHFLARAATPGAAMRRALLLLPRYFGATILVSLPPAARWASAIAASLPDGSSSPCSIVLMPIHLPLGSTPTPEPV